jgi:hypothetical protein
MYSEQYFSIFTTEKNRRQNRTSKVGFNSVTSYLIQALRVNLKPEPQFYHYDPLFRLCHYRRVKAP